jgi:hypothetical protein
MPASSVMPANAGIHVLLLTEARGGPAFADHDEHKQHVDARNKSGHDEKMGRAAQVPRAP